MIEASQASTASFTAAGPVSQSFHIAKKTPTLTFNLSALPAKTDGDPDFSVASYASSNSPAAITFALGAGSVGCSVTSGGTVSLSLAAIGTCIITASQSGNANYNAAASVQQSFTIGLRTGTVSYIGQTLF